MIVCHDLWQELCDYENLELAFKKARKHKTLKPYVVDFEQSLSENLSLLRAELLFHTYHPQPLKTFIIHEPKTRKISKSEFRDRVIHHALCNIIEPLFESAFIHDSYANRKGKGTLKAIERFNHFKRKISQNFTKPAFVLKADVKRYFETINHQILFSLLKKKIRDKKVLWLIKVILSNYHVRDGVGMPLGNLTSQFFANVYLNELDQFVKHRLKEKCYIRYVDDFVILHKSEEELQRNLTEINYFLQKHLSLELHPLKSRIISLHRGTEFLGMKIFPRHKTIKRKNQSRFYRKFYLMCKEYDSGRITYDEIYDFLEGWNAYAKNADTYSLRRRIAFIVEEKFAGEISTKEINRYDKNAKKSITRHPVKISSLLSKSL